MSDTLPKVKGAAAQTKKQISEGDQNLVSKMEAISDFSEGAIRVRQGGSLGNVQFRREVTKVLNKIPETVKYSKDSKELQRAVVF